MVGTKIDSVCGASELTFEGRELVPAVPRDNTNLMAIARRSETCPDGTCHLRRGYHRLLTVQGEGGFWAITRWL